MNRIEVPSRERDAIEEHLEAEFVKVIDRAEIIYGDMNPVDLYFLAGNSLNMLLLKRRVKRG